MLHREERNCVKTLMSIKSAQQSVHRTARTLRVFEAGSKLWQFSVS